MKYVIGFFIFAVTVLTVATGVFIVDQRQYAVVFAMGEMKHIIDEPGIYFKWPNPFQNVSFFDKRMTSTSSREPDRMVTADKIDILVDHFVKWQIQDPKKFYVSFGTDEQAAHVRIAQLARTQLTQTLSKFTVRELLNTPMDKITQQVLKQIRQEVDNYGIAVADVRVKRVDYSEERDQAIFERMKTERSRQAQAIRTQVATEVARVKGQADAKRERVLTEQRHAVAGIIGNAQAKAAAIYAQTSKQDPEFFRFYQTMQTYQQGFSQRKQMLVIDPNSEFFRYMKPGEGVQ